MSTVKPTGAELEAGIKLATGELHTIVLHRTTLDVRILDYQGKPVAKLLCEVALAKGKPQPFYTDDDGWIHADLSPAEGDVRLTVPEVDRPSVPPASEGS